MSRSLSVKIVCVLLVVTVLGQGLVAAADSSRPTSLPDGSSDQTAAQGPPMTIATQDGFAQSTFQIEVFGNGSARWTFRFVRPLANDSEREQFTAFADRFESEETDFYRTYRERSVALTNTASNTTGREMTARNFSRSARIVPTGNRGIVEVSFVWTNLAVVDGDRVRVADIFDGGFYIASNQWLVFEAGPDLAFDPATTEPSPDEFSGDTLAGSETLTWIGEQQFTDKHPRVVFGPAGQVTTTGQEAATTDGSAGGPTTNGSAGGADDQSGSSFPMLVVGLVVLVVGIGAGAAWRRGAFGSSTPSDGGAGASSVDRASADDGSSASAASAGSDAAESTASAAEPAVPDEELLTDEDRVIRMLEDSGGRMKQANIVDETGWSKSKVSMLLSDMEDEGDISKLRVGRENIVSLKGHEPDAAGSPFDDED